MKVRLRVILLGLIAIVVGSGLTWFWTHFERVPVPVDEGYGAEARRNPFLAAERLLDAHGVESRTVHRITDPPPSHGALFFPASRRRLPVTFTRSLRDWVEGGGHLIVVGERESEHEKDELLGDVGLELIEVGDEEDGDGEEGDEDAGPDGAVGAELDWDGVKTVLQVEFRSRFRLGARDGWYVYRRGADGRFQSIFRLGAHDGALEAVRLAADRLGWHAVTLEVGRGRLTVLSDARFAVNAEIGKHDHAAFLLHLVRMHPAANVWFVQGGDVSSLWARIEAKGAPVLVSGAVLLLAWAWGVSRRFGPVLEDAPRSRRRLLEHIEASGRFFWRHRQVAELLEATRESLLRSLEFRHPGWSTSADLHRKLAGTTGLAIPTVKAALEENQSPDEQSFTQTIQVLEMMRKHL